MGHLVALRRSFSRTFRRYWPILAICGFLLFGVLKISTIISDVHRRVPELFFDESNGYNKSYLQYLNGIYGGVSSADQDMQQRVSRIRNMCKVNPKRYSGRTPLKSSDQFMMHSPESHVSFCKVAKIASTFWSRILYMETHHTSFSDPFEVSMSQLNSFRAVSRSKHMDLDKSEKIIWVRDPYSRLFAVYVDKVYAPNPTFWGYISRPAINMFRENSPRCAHDLTFAEFLKFAVFSETKYPNKKREMHFIPIFDTCKPCYNNFSFIGRMEHFPEDAIYTLKTLGLQKYVPYVGNMSQPSYERDAIYDTIQSVFAWKRDIVKCMTFDEALRRVWRKLQIRGLISTTTYFPLRQEQSKNIQMDLFLKIAQRLNEGYSPEQRKANKANRLDALAQAYSNIPQQDLQSIRKIYAEDFELFGYDPEPDFLNSHARKDNKVNFLEFRDV